MEEKTEIVNVQVDRDGLTIRATQEYRTEFNHGHYRFYIQNDDGDVVRVNQSMGGAPRYKIDEERLEGWLREYIVEKERWGE